MVTKTKTPAAAKEPKRAAEPPAPQFTFTYPAREVLEQINLQIPGELGFLRQAAQACFHALNDQGGNSPTTVTATAGAGEASVKVTQAPYVHG